MTEFLNVVDVNRNFRFIKERNQVHIDGDWHETFQCWFVEVNDEHPSLYLQLRSKMKKDFPSLYDITAAGHLLAHETVKDGVREIKEELGIEVTIEELQFLGAIPNTIKQGSFIDNEISLVYLYQVNNQTEFTFEDAEVEGVSKVSLHAFEQLLRGKVNSIAIQHVAGEARGVTYLTKEMLVPHENHYFTEVLKRIKAQLNTNNKGESI